MTSTRSKLWIGAALLVALAACDDKGSSSKSQQSSGGGGTTPPSTAATTPEDQISSQFAADFKLGANALPVPKPSQSDLPPVSLTATPIAVH